MALPARRLLSVSAFLSFVCILLFLGFRPSQAQDEEIKWGKVPQRDLEMTEFPDDSNAAAVILADVGEVYFTGDFEMVFERHRRIKILSESGYDWGNVFISFYAEDGLQKISKGDIKGQTFKLTPDGSKKRMELEKKSIYEEDVDGEWRRMRFTLPDLSPGCVIEYRYKMVSKNPVFLRDWEFQSSEPTLWSEFRAEIPQFYHYVMINQEIGRFDKHERESYDWPPTRTSRGVRFLCTKFVWGMRNVPALRSEPFITTLDDYRQQIRFQLAKVVFPRMAPREIMESWEKLAQDLLDHKEFGREIERHKVLREQAEALVANLTDPNEKMRTIYDYVRSSMTWNKERGIYCEQDLDDVFKSKHAAGPEIALMLTGMLRFAGLEAHPVLISTRSHGKIIRTYSILSQFNHVLTYVRAGESDYLLGATDPLRPYDILPVQALNETGWLVDKDNVRFITITKPADFVNQTVVSAELNDDGEIRGWFESMDSQYSAVFDRNTLLEKPEDEYIRDGWLSDLTGAQLDSFTIRNRDSTDAPLVTKAHFSTTDHVQVAGDRLLFNPVFFGRREQNPFRSPTRSFPVDFAYGRKITYTLNLRLPENYEVEELPKPKIYILPDGAGHFRYLIDDRGKVLMLTTQMLISKTRFEPHEYDLLREFYDSIVEWHAKPVVLKGRLLTGQP